jgi:hypothetical protein
MTGTPPSSRTRKAQRPSSWHNRRVLLPLPHVPWQSRMAQRRSPAAPRVCTSSEAQGSPSIDVTGDRHRCATPAVGRLTVTHDAARPGTERDAHLVAQGERHAETMRSLSLIDMLSLTSYLGVRPSAAAHAAMTSRSPAAMAPIRRVVATGRTRLLWALGRPGVDVHSAPRIEP